MLGLMSVAWGSGKSPRGLWLIVGIVVLLLWMYERNKTNAAVP